MSRPLTPDQVRSIEQDLLTQVDPDNVLQAAGVLRGQADELRAALHRAATEMWVGRCGLDPVSHDVQRAFNAKVEGLLAVHWAHHSELEAAVEALHRTARSYGYTEADIERAFRSVQAARSLSVSQ